MRLLILSCSAARHVAFHEMIQRMTICLELVAEVDADFESNKTLCLKRVAGRMQRLKEENFTRQ